MSEVVQGAELEQPLSNREIALLDQLEADIERNIKGFKKVGYALLVIRDQRLHREKYDTFADYLREEWDLSPSYASRQISGYQVVEKLRPVAEEMLPIGNKIELEKLLPTNENQARAIAELPDEEQEGIWKMVLQTANDQGLNVSGRLIRECIAALRQGAVKDAVDKGVRQLREIEAPEHITSAAQTLLDLVCMEADRDMRNAVRKKLAEVLREILEAVDG